METQTSNARTDHAASGSRSAKDPARATEVFYDGACPVCRNEIKVYKKMMGDAVTWSDVSASAPEGLDREALLARLHARRADGSVVSGPAAFLAIWRNSRRLGPLARLLDREPFLTIGEGLYQVFLRIRRLWRR